MPDATKDRSWVSSRIRIIEADFNRSSDTHLLRVAMPCAPRIALYLKDESTHPTGSLKHRLARSLFLYGLCNGWIGPDTTIVEASSGSTAVSEAYFARMLGLRFIAVMPRSTSAEKIAMINFYGGESHFVESAAEMYAESARLAASLGGHYMDQFTYAERATDWRGNNNIARIHLRPDGRRGASRSDMDRRRGRNRRALRRRSGAISVTAACRRACALPILRHPPSTAMSPTSRCGSVRIAVLDRGDRTPSGASRPSCPSLIDRAYAVSDAASLAAARVLSRRIGRSCGGSTGTNMWAVAQIVSEMIARGDQGSVATLLM